jgi:hypothetical protein
MTPIANICAIFENNAKKTLTGQSCARGKMTHGNLKFKIFSDTVLLKDGIATIQRCSGSDTDSTETAAPNSGGPQTNLEKIKKSLF